MSSSWGGTLSSLGFRTVARTSIWISRSACQCKVEKEELFYTFYLGCVLSLENFFLGCDVLGYEVFLGCDAWGYDAWGHDSLGCGVFGYGVLGFDA